MAVAGYRGCAGGESWRFWEALPLIGSGPGPSPVRTPLLVLREETAMAEDMEKESHESPEQAAQKADIAIFCCAVIGVVVFVIGMVKGVFG